MTNYKRYSDLLSDIEKHAKEHLFSEVENLVTKARKALRKDLRDQGNQRRNEWKFKNSARDQRHG